VVESVGDHACEYMTGGRVVVIGAVGRNFAAGMSGGVAHVLDLDPALVNPELVDQLPLTAEESDLLQDLVRRHHEETGSERAAKLLADWDAAGSRFTTVMPRDYARVLAAKAAAERDGLDEDATTRAMMEAI
jgi:glutamate synthase (NADPH/NADH) large chain